MADSEPVSPPPETLKPIDRLIRIMSILRSDRGCPWDREQSLESLKDYLIEETYEVVDAIQSGDRNTLREELGDLLLQVVFQAQLCTESGDFTFDDVADSIVRKLIRRHPHVFGDVTINDSGDVIRNWEEIKRAEKGGKPRSTVEGIPRSLPALHRAHLIQKRVARVGFDWESVEGALDKLEEEIREVRQAVEEGKEDAIRDEIGDLLFATVNVSRFFGDNAEDILEKNITKFTRRFQRLEEILHERNLDMAELDLAALDKVWDDVKAEEKAES